MKKIIARALLLSVPAEAGIQQDSTPPGFKLQIAPQLELTDKNGVVIPSQVIKAEVGRLVALCKTDGFRYDGQITEIEESDDYLKVYGKILNVPDTNFGFAMFRGGVFAGAILEKEDNRTYVLEFSDKHKGFVFVRSFKHNKPVASNKKKAPGKLANL
jgi:hypothetical protein